MRGVQEVLKDLGNMLKHLSDTLRDKSLVVHDTLRSVLRVVQEILQHVLKDLQEYPKVLLHGLQCVVGHLVDHETVLRNLEQCPG